MTPEPKPEAVAVAEQQKQINDTWTSIKEAAETLERIRAKEREMNLAPQVKRDGR